MKRFLTICITAESVLAMLSTTVVAQIQVSATDMTPTTPLSSPLPDLHEPRYISGFGSGDSFTLFFEDRSVGFPYPVSFISTTIGPTGFPDSATLTNVKDTHFCVKDWSTTIEGTTYAYRAWGALENTEKHNFYVSDNLEKWTLVSTFTIPNFEEFHSGYVYYGFHDVIELNGTYYAWGECNIGHTLICRSTDGANDWEAFARVGGIGSGPLELPFPGTPTGSFFEFGDDRGYGKIMVPGDDSAFYLAINTAAKPSLLPADLEAAFINPDNWTWHDGTTGPANNPILKETSEHNLKECWLIPNGSTDWIILYDAEYFSHGTTALGYATLSAPLPCIPVSLVSLNEGPLLVPVDMSVSFQAIIADGCGQVDALWDFDDGIYYEQSDVQNPVTATHTYNSAGIFLVVLGLSDDSGSLIDGGSLSVVVYDPTGDFVTGGGWIYSNPESYIPDPSLEGKASFGFVSKYKKGATVPTGQTEFVFNAGDLNFHSSSYEWLVVTGSNYARFKGWGTISGEGDYRFMLWAGDAPDTFRIKIWEEDELGNENPVYDNGSDQEIGGGSIVIHTK